MTEPNAEVEYDPTDPTDDLTLMAKTVVVMAVRDSLLSQTISHGDFPEIGVYDWVRIEQEAMRIATAMSVSASDQEAAYRRLAARADGGESE